MMRASVALAARCSLLPGIAAVLLMSNTGGGVATVPGVFKVVITLEPPTFPEATTAAGTGMLKT